MTGPHGRDDSGDPDAPRAGKSEASGTGAMSDADRPESRVERKRRRWLSWPLAFVLLAALVVGGGLAGLWLTLRSAERTVELAAQTLRLEVRRSLSQTLLGLRSSRESFLVAWQFGTTLHATDEREMFWGFVPLAESRVDVGWSFTVDYGIDLAKTGSEPLGTLHCRPDENACTWIVPPPEHRPPAIDTNSIRVGEQRSLLFTDRARQEHRDEVLRRLTLLTKAELKEPGLQALVRPSVREGLERFARRVVAASWDGDGAPPTVAVLFSDEPAAQAIDGMAVGEEALPSRVLQPE